MQYHNICNLRHLGMVKLKQWQNACKMQASFKKKIKRWHNACKMQANVLAFRQCFTRVWLKKKLNAGKMPAKHKQMCLRFASVLPESV